MNKLFTAALGLAVAALPVLGVGLAAAQDDEPEACVAAKVELEAALKAALDLSPDVYPGNVVPSLGQLPGLLDDILADPDLGAGGRAVVQAAVAAQAKVKAACDTTPPTTTPPPPTTTVPPTTTPAPDDDVDCDEVSDKRAQEILDADKSDPNNLDEDGDGVACEEDVTIVRDRVVVPSGGVNTGGGPA